uniref:Uncharacterized protein n=1 Tax=Oryza punctata TaxID=4537 RepID=A0A0E0LJ19_ORYPU
MTFRAQHPVPTVILEPNSGYTPTCGVVAVVVTAVVMVAQGAWREEVRCLLTRLMAVEAQVAAVEGGDALSPCQAQPGERREEPGLAVAIPREPLFRHLVVVISQATASSLLSSNRAVATAEALLRHLLLDLSKHSSAAAPWSPTATKLHGQVEGGEVWSQQQYHVLSPVGDPANQLQRHRAAVAHLHQESEIAEVKPTCTPTTTAEHVETSRSTRAQPTLPDRHTTPEIDEIHPTIKHEPCLDRAEVLHDHPGPDADPADPPAPLQAGTGCHSVTCHRDDNLAREISATTILRWRISGNRDGDGLTTLREVYRCRFGTNKIKAKARKNNQTDKCLGYLSRHVAEGINQTVPINKRKTDINNRVHVIVTSIVRRQAISTNLAGEDNRPPAADNSPSLPTSMGDAKELEAERSG